MPQGIFIDIKLQGVVLGLGSVGKEIEVPAQESLYDLGGRGIYAIEFLEPDVADAAVALAVVIFLAYYSSRNFRARRKRRKSAAR